MDITFPFEFVVRGTPVSAQAARSNSKEAWKTRVRTASELALSGPHFATEEPISVTLYYFPDDPMQGDIDNIIKLVLDALSRHIYLDDSQVERIVVQKFEPKNIFPFTMPTPALALALASDKPVLYVRLSNKPFEELA